MSEFYGSDFTVDQNAIERWETKKQPTKCTDLTKINFDTSVTDSIAHNHLRNVACLSLRVQLETNHWHQ